MPVNGDKLTYSEFTLLLEADAVPRDEDVLIEQLAQPFACLEVIVLEDCLQSLYVERGCWRFKYGHGGQLG